MGEEVLSLAYRVMSFPLLFPDHPMVSEKNRGRTVTASFDGKYFNVEKDRLTDFDEGFAALCFEHSGMKDEFYD